MALIGTRFFPVQAQTEIVGKRWNESLHCHLYFLLSTKNKMQSREFTFLEK